MFFILFVLYSVGFNFPAIVHGYSKECSFNQTIFTPDGNSATFVANFTLGIHISLEMRKTSGTSRGKIVYVVADRFVENVTDLQFKDRTWENRTQISTKFYSDHNNLNFRLDLNNVSMNNNGTYQIHTRSYYEIACFILYVMEIKTEPSNVREENEPVLVYAHPHVSLIKRPLANARMSWFLDGETVNQTAIFIEQDDHIWISSVGIHLNGKNVTYRAVHDDGRIVEMNVTLVVEYGPIHPLTIVPRKSYYNLVSGEVLPDITCKSECNPPCNISWGKYGVGNTLSLGAVTTEDTGEYTCTATRADGRTVEQIISVFVMDVLVSVTVIILFNVIYLMSFFPRARYNTHFTTAIACLATIQTLTILALGVCTFYFYKRKALAYFHQILEFVSRNTSYTPNDTFSASHVEGSENDCYEELSHGTRIENNAYGDVSLAIPGDGQQLPANTYENTNISS